MWEDEIPMENPEGFETLFDPILLKKRLEGELVELDYDPSELEDLYSKFQSGQLSGDPDGYIYTIMASYAYFLILEKGERSLVSECEVGGIMGENVNEWVKDVSIDPKHDTGMNLRLAA